MMRIFYLLFMSMLLCSGISAQVSLLVEGGANYGKTEITGIETLKQENISSYYVAVNPKLPLFNQLNAFAEVQFSREGADLFFDGNVDPQSFRIYYFRLVPGLELDLVGPLSLIAGANIGFATIENIDGRVLNGPSGFDVSIYDRYDYGALAGLNINIEGINIVAKYNFGLRDVFGLNFTDINGVLLPSESRNRFLQVGLGYEFGF